MLAKKMRAAVMFPLLLLTACAPAINAGPPPVKMGYCGSNLQVKPDVVLVVCNTDDITATHLTWSDWGKPTASASGSALVDLCAYEDCANPSVISVPIHVIASKIVSCASNTRAYSTLRYVFVDGSPWPNMPANLNTSGYIGAPNRPLPPANHTVRLTC